MSQEKSTYRRSDLEADLIDFVRSHLKPLVVILGHTASGKTSLSIQLAKLLNDTWKGERAEIVNGDSRQLYRGLDIGTAKIRPDEMESIPHHLIDVLRPIDRVSIAWYQEQALKTIREIHDRKHIPILVGGSMLYISSVIDGLLPLPERSEEVRQRLQDEYDFDEGKTLHAKLSQIDPKLASTTSPKNSVHLIRAMEIVELTGKAPSEMKRKEAPPFDVFIIGCEVPLPRRKELIERRTKELFLRGWLQEVEQLLMSGVKVEDPAMESVGYREIAQAIQQQAIDGEALITSITKQTLEYAKRQMTWWKRDERIRWID